MNIRFSPPDITEKEIEQVIEALRSGWITTGPKTKFFEKRIAEYCGASKAVCLNSATAGLELVLRILGVGEGNEVITSAYTYTASASVIDHVGAKIVLCDIQKDSLEMDYDLLASLITPRTKVIIPVDIGGIMCDYNKIYNVIEGKKQLFCAKTDLQKAFGRIIILSDAAHSFGAKSGEVCSGMAADFTSFSFHAVKNLTTAEGGAIVWRDNAKIDNEYLYKKFMLWSLHGQSKDALSKTQLGSWEYDIELLGYKCNMTDVVAGIGLAQLERYEGILSRRRKMIEMYDAGFEDKEVSALHHYTKSNSSGHLYITRVKNATIEQRNDIIKQMAEQGIATNVHYKPLPLHSAYIAKGFNIINFSNAYSAYKNEITLPLHTLLTDDEVKYIIENYNRCIEAVLHG